MKWTFNPDLDHSINEITENIINDYRTENHSRPTHIVVSPTTKRAILEEFDKHCSYDGKYGDPKEPEKYKGMILSVVQVNKPYLEIL